MAKTKVALIKCDEYNLKEVEKAINYAISLIGGFDRLRKKGKKVLLKPNILAGKEPEYAVTTHPVVFEATIKIFLENGFEVAAGESPPLEPLGIAAKKAGLLDVVEKYKIPFYEFKNPIKISNPDGKLIKSFNISEEILNFDIIVSLPKLKTHAQMYYTGAMKNLFGCITGLQKPHFHLRFPDRDDFANMIVDLNLLLKPSLGIMDGIVAMEGKGPQGGTPKKVGLIATSFDILALDLVCAELIGYKYIDIPIIKNALERKNFFISSPEEIEIVGEKIENLKPSHFEKVKITSEVHFLQNKVPKPIINFINNITVPKPHFKHKVCIKCGKCISICPANALQFKNKNKNKFVHIDYNKCIKCYCCDEICPVKAIELKIRPF
ncbi:MAG: DUF362 domain-containing protein [Brevinematales bacterium]|nr:DUF362 domain-containing protein [Brevinematales bacterium]